MTSTEGLLNIYQTMTMPALWRGYRFGRPIHAGGQFYLGHHRLLIYNYHWSSDSYLHSSFHSAENVYQGLWNAVLRVNRREGHISHK